MKMHIQIAATKTGYRVYQWADGVPSGEIKNFHTRTISNHPDAESAKKKIKDLAKKHGLIVDALGRSARND